MFGNAPPQIPLERRGAVDPGRPFIPDGPGVRTGEEVQEEKVHIYVDHQKVQKGEIAQMPDNWTFYDFIFEDSANAERLRGYFHDWAVPPHKGYRDAVGKDIRKIQASKTFYRGSVTESSFRPEQHIYVVLNNLLQPTVGYGDPEGADVSKMHILACVFIGDTRRNGFLANAYVEYALRLNAPWTQWAGVASRIMDPETGRPLTYYNVIGDPEIMGELTTRWFRTKNDYSFNRVIYPVSQNGETSM